LEKLDFFKDATNILTEADFSVYITLRYNNLDDFFPRQTFIQETNDTQNFFDLAIYSNDHSTFQTLTPQCFFKHTNFNYISDHYLKVNI
jgi:hypothetical protein